MNMPATPKPAPAGGKSDFTFADQVKKPTLKARLSQPVSIAAIALALGVIAFIVYLEVGRVRADLPTPEVSYTLLPNEGKTGGVPIAIKLNQIAVFVVDDPIQGEAGAARAKKIVAILQQAVMSLKDEPGKVITLDEETPMPAIVQQEHDGTQRTVIVQMMPGDLALAGETDAKRLARVWAERLTDALKLIAFGEAPEFSIGTDFGSAIETLYAIARERHGWISQSSLDDAFGVLTDGERLVLETVPSRQPTPRSGQ